jgi:hypothetical protein
LFNHVNFKEALIVGKVLQGLCSEIACWASSDYYNLVFIQPDPYGAL